MKLNLNPVSTVFSAETGLKAGKLAFTALILLIVFSIPVLGSTTVGTDYVTVERIVSPSPVLTIESVVNMTSNSIESVNNLFFSSTAYIVQNSDGDNMVFQLDNSAGTRKTFMTFDVGALTVSINQPVSMRSNQINNLSDPTEAQDAATMSWVNSNDNDTNTQLDDQMAAGPVDMGGFQVNNLTDPTEAQDAATKSYVDSQAGGSSTIWVDDTDRDGYIENHTDDFKVSSTQPASGWIKVEWGNSHDYFGASKTQYDCYDQNASAYPGQTTYFSNARGDGSFDYNCDSSEVKRWTDYSTACDSAAQQNIKWYNAVPACGQEGDLTDEWDTCNDGTRIQECR